MKKISFQKSITPNSWLCKNCWEIVNDFHKFHTRIEEAHAYFVNMLKTELQEANEDMGMTILKSDLTGDETSCGQDRYTECLNNNTKEDESQSLEIKEEVEIIEEQLIHVDVQISMKRKSKNKDPLQKPLPGKSRKLRKSLKSVQAAAPESANNKETLEDDETEISIENTTNQNEDSSHSPTDFVDDCNRLSSSSESESEDQNQTGKTSNEWKPRPNPYYKPCTKRKETDEFLAKHFKIICAICQSSMHTFHELTKHFSKQHNEPAYAVCCNRKFLKCSLLVDHIHCHLDPDYFKCKHCGKLMSDRRCLELHAKTHGIQDKTHICDICQKGFSRKIGLRNHKLIHLSDEEKKFACDQCGKL